MFNGYFDVVLADQDLTRPDSWLDTLLTKVQPFIASGIALLALLFLLRRRCIQTQAAG